MVSWVAWSRAGQLAAVLKNGVESQEGQILTAALPQLRCGVPGLSCIVTPLDTGQRGRAVKRCRSFLMSSLKTTPF